jgi:hypothetical protein
VIKGLKAVNPIVFPHFMETAEKLINDVGAEKAMCMALAYISGQTSKINVRSIITAEEGLQTIEMKTGKDIRSEGYIYSLLN